MLHRHLDGSRYLISSFFDVFPGVGTRRSRWIRNVDPFRTVILYAVIKEQELKRQLLRPSLQSCWRMRIYVGLLGKSWDPTVADTVKSSTIITDNMFFFTDHEWQYTNAQESLTYFWRRTLGTNWWRERVDAVMIISLILGSTDVVMFIRHDFL